jgi:hypothetical protein
MKLSNNCAYTAMGEEYVPFGCGRRLRITASAVMFCVVKPLERSRTVKGSGEIASQ